MENDLKGIENYFELMGGLSYRGFELPGVDCKSLTKRSKKWAQARKILELLVQKTSWN